MTHVLDRASFVGDEQEVELGELVPLALEQACDAAAGRDVLAVGDDPEVRDLAADVHPWTEAHIATEDPIGGKEEIAGMRDFASAEQDEVLAGLVEEGGRVLGAKRRLP